MNLSSNLQSELPLVEEENFELAVTDLSKHVNDVEIFQFNSEIPIKGATISENMHQKVRRQSHYIECTFVDSVFDSVGLSGTKFIRCQFKTSDYTGANMSSCSFENVTWIGDRNDRLIVKRVSFNRSIFTDCTFENVNFLSSRFMDTVFYNCNFIRCKMRLCALENTSFNECMFDEMDFSTGNMSFSEFSKLRSRNSIFSFHSLNFTFGLLKTLSNSPDVNYVYSANSKRILYSEYIKMFPEFEMYYIHDGKYFPLVNLYSLQGKKDLAFLAVKEGYRYAVQTKDFRMIKYYSKQIYVNDIFDAALRRKLYNQLQDWLHKAKLSVSENFQFQLEAYDIRKYLLANNYEKPTIYVDLQTNIDSNEIEKNDFMLNMLEVILLDCEYCSKSIEYKHNSDFAYLITMVFDNIAQINHVLILLYGSLGGFWLFGKTIKQMVGAFQEIQQKNDQHHANKLANEKARLELEYLIEDHVLEHEQKELELQKMRNDVMLTTTQQNETSDETEQIVAETYILQNNPEIIQKSKKNYETLVKKNISVKISHYSENIETAPLPEMVQFHSSAV